MKYLRRIYENSEEDLRDFCETNLAYLLDEGYELFIGDYRGSKSISLSLGRDRIHRLINKFRWDDVKDHFIPFLVRLQNRYEIVKPNYNYMKELAFIGSFTSQYYTVQEVLDDKPIELEYLLYDINFFIDL